LNNLAADQLLFALADWAIGVAVDRARAALRWIGWLRVLLSGQIVAGAIWGCLLCASIGVASGAASRWRLAAAPAR
jgi:hypothetical protein